MVEPYLKTEEAPKGVILPQATQGEIIQLYKSSEPIDTNISSQPTERKRRRRSINVGDYAIIKADGEKVMILDKKYDEDINEWYYAVEGRAILMTSSDLIAPKAKKDNKEEKENE